MVDNRLSESELKTIAQKAGSQRTLERLGYSQQEASMLRDKYRREPEVFGRRSAGIPEKKMVVTTGTIQAQQLGSVKVIDTSQGAVTIRTAPSGTVTSTRTEKVTPTGQIETTTNNQGKITTDRTINKSSIQSNLIKGTRTDIAPINKQSQQIGFIESTERPTMTNNQLQSQNFVSAYQEPTGILASNIYRYNRATEQYETDVIRGEKKTFGEKFEYGKDLVKLGANQGVSGVIGGVNLIFALSGNTRETIQAIKEQIKIQTPAIDFGTTLATNPTRSILSGIGNVAVTYGTGKIISAGLGSFGKIETALGYPKYVTTFKATQIGATEKGTNILGRALTTRQGLFSNRVYASMFYSDIRNFGQNQLGATRFIGGSGAVTRERTMLLGYPNRFKYGEVVQSGSIVRGISKELPQIEGGFIFRGSAKSYGQAKGTSAFAGVGVEEATKITSAVKDVPVVNGKLTKTGSGYTMGIVEKADREALNNIIKQGDSGSVLKKATDGTSSVTIGQAKPLIEANIKALEKTDIIKTSEILSKVSLTTNTILSSTRVLPSVSAYAGQGTYETTNSVVYNNPSVSIPSSVILVSKIDYLSSVSSILNIIPKVNAGVISRTENRSSSRSRQEQSPLQETKQINQFRQGIEQRTNQQTIQAQLQSQKQIQKQVVSSGVFFKPTPFIAPEVFIPFNINRKQGEKKKKGVQAFIPIVKVKGKEIAIGGLQERGVALSNIQKFLSQTLSASGYIKPTGEYIEGKGTSFRASQGFRQARIVKGERKYNPNILIQKSGTKFNKDIGGNRLSSRAEINAILGYKKR